MAIIFYFGWSWVDEKLPDLTFNPPAAAGKIKSLWLWTKEIPVYLFKGVLWFISLIFFTALNVILFILLASVTGSPFYDRLSSKIENLQGSLLKEIPFNFRNGIVYPVINSAKMSLFGLIIALFAFPLNWIPLAGSMLYIACISIPLSMNLMGYSAERRLMPFSRLLKTTWEWKWEFLGFGIAAFLSMMPFGLNIITFPLSVAGATIMFIDKNKGC